MAEQPKTEDKGQTEGNETKRKRVPRRVKTEADVIGALIAAGVVEDDKKGKAVVDAYAKAFGTAIVALAKDPNALLSASANVDKLARKAAGVLLHAIVLERQQVNAASTSALRFLASLTQRETVPVWAPGPNTKDGKGQIVIAITPRDPLREAIRRDAKGLSARVTVQLATDADEEVHAFPWQTLNYPRDAAQLNAMEAAWKKAKGAK